MTVDELRAKEIAIREKLATIRTDLAASTVVLADAARAKEQIAAVHGPNDGVYRKAADERFGSLRDRVAVTLAAESDRERLRSQETALLVQLEESREALLREGASRVVIPVLADIPKAAPCPMRWGDMTGDGDERVCTRCHKVARNVAFIEPEDVAKFPAADPRVPFHRRVDGTILAGNCEQGEHEQRVTRAMGTGLALVLVVVAGILFSFEVAKKQVLPPSPPTPASSQGAGPGPLYNLYDRPPPIAYPTGTYQDRLHDVTSVHVVDTTVVHGGTRKIDLSISTFGDRFVGFLTCGGSNKQIQVDVPGLTVQGFFDQINATQDSDSDAGSAVTCAAMTRKIQIDVVMPGNDNTVSLAMNNCRPQWIENGKQLKGETPQGQSPFTNRISTHYRNILATLPVTTCTPQMPITHLR